MNHTRSAFPPLVGCLVAFGLAVAAWPATAHAQAKRKNPASKMYVSDVSGDALIESGDTVEDLTKRSVYNAEGAIIETKRPSSDKDQKKHYSTMVYSNGTGAFFDADTRVEVKRFAQEPFTPTRSDVDVEPSISQTQAYVARGAVGLCNSKLVAGSSMTYQTPLGSVNIRGKKVVIEAGARATKISMLDGESTVRAGPGDASGRTLKSGQQAIIRPGADGQTNEIVIGPIPPSEKPQLDDKVAMACMAKRTVYFEERVRKVDLAGKTGEAAATETPARQASDSSTDNGGDAASRVTAFDGGTGRGSSATVREIVPVEIVPVTLPTEYTVSPARITAPGR